MDKLIWSLQAGRLTPSFNQRPIIVRCFSWGEFGQLATFKVTADRAVVIFGGELKVEYLNLKDMRISSWSITNFVDWLLGSHIHFIISHIHQGIENFGWSVVDLYKELQRLKSHEGFPRGNKLNCPVFTQDKMVYLNDLTDLVMPSFCIPIPDMLDDDTTTALITRYDVLICTSAIFVLLKCFSLLLSLYI